MGLLERIAESRSASMAYTVGADLMVGTGDYGHDDSLYSPEKYGDYIVTSNDVYAAVSLRARLLSALSLDLFNGRDEKKKRITTGPAVDLLRHVNPFWTFPRLRRMDELSMGVWGESFWAVEKSRGIPKNIWWLKSPRVKPVVHKTEYLKGFLYDPPGGGDPVAFAPDEVVWFRYPNPLDEFSALSPLAAARLAADTAKAMQVANKNLFDQGLTAAGLIVPATDKVTFSQDQATELEELFEKRMRGADKAHRWAVLRYEAQLKQLSVTPKDAEYVNGMVTSLRQVANAYGIPTPLLNDPMGATLSNVREYQRQLWEHTLVPDAGFGAAEIEEQLLPMFGRSPGRTTVDHVAWDYSKVPALQESASEIWGRDRQMIEVGAKTINEWRVENGMPPVPWGDVYWRPVNKEPVDDADAAGTDPAVSPQERVTASIYQQIDDLGAQLTLAGHMPRNGHHREGN